MQAQDLSDELWREYLFNGRKYRINKPEQLILGDTTHRIIDSEGIVHCVPSVGLLGCVLRWKPKPGANPVAF